MVPLLSLQLTSSVEQNSGIKESKIRLILDNCVTFITSDFSLVQDVTAFAKAPPGVSKRDLNSMKHC